MAEHTENPFIAMMNRSELPLKLAFERNTEKLPEPVKEDQSSKVVVVTGANAGIGYETSKFVAGLNPKKLIMACRNISKANEAINKIKSETGCANIEAWELDLSSIESVKAFAKKFNESGLPLDTLVSNAGVAGNEWVETKDGYEVTLQVNHIGNVLLVLLLTPALRKSSSPRVEIVASDVHFWAAQPKSDDPTPLSSVLKKPDPLPFFHMYPISKLFNVLFAQEYARRNKDIWICSSTPGYTESELGSKDMATGEAREKHDGASDLPKRSTYDGAKTIIHCAVHPNPGKSGAWFSEMRDTKTRSDTIGEVGEKFGANLWKDTMNVLRKHVNESDIEAWAWN